MIFKRFSLHRIKPELCNICEQEILKSNFFSKNKRSFQSFEMYIPALVISFLLHNNFIHKVWVDLINERQHRNQGFMDKITKSHGINLSQGQGVFPENYNYLNPTELLDLCCSVVQFIPLDCRSIAVV